MMRVALWLVGGAALLALVGCGDEQEAPVTTCSASQPLRVTGEVGGVDATSVRNNDNGNLAPTVPVGDLTDRRVTLDLGEVEFLPAGAAEPELRPRLLVLTTNVGDPGGSSLQENLNRRLGSGQPDANILRVVEREADQYCDVEAGEICVLFGMDDTRNRELLDDKVFHAGVGGTITIDALSAVRLDMSFDVQLGPNKAVEVGGSGGGQVEGCFAAQKGNAAGGAEPLNVPGG